MGQSVGFRGRSVKTEPKTSAPPRGTAPTWCDRVARRGADLLGTTALCTTLMGSGLAVANTVEVGGVPAPDNSPAFIWVPLPAAPTNIVVDTQSIVAGGLNAVWVTGLAADTSVVVAPGLSVTTAAWGVAVSSTTGNISVVNNGSIEGGVAGIYANPRFALDGGNVTISGTGTVSSAAGPAILAEMDTGNVDINGFSAISGGTYGVQVFTGGTWTGNPGGTFNIGTTTPLGPITSLGVGIGTLQANAFGEGATNIVATSIDAGTYGILSTATTGAINIATTGEVKAAALTGIAATTTTGNIGVDGRGTSSVTGGDEGVTVASITGNVAVRNFASITGADSGIWAPVSGSGTIDIQGNGAITGTARWGILAGNAGGTGDINIGTAATNGPISGGSIGIDAWTIGTGNVNITTGADVTGTATWGILARALNGDITSNLNAGTVSGGGRGYEAAIGGTGSSTTNVAAGVTVQGGVYGLLTATVSGNATVNNAGIIKSTGDTGAAGTLGGDAIWNYLGSSIVNNSGLIIGRVHTNTLASAFNNDAGGVWTPGVGENVFAGVADAVNNAGTINIRSGHTVFRSLEDLNNRPGGVINMQYGPAATDALSVVNFNPAAGSTARFNVDFAKPNSSGAEALANDHSSNGLGTADTIVVFGNANPQATTIVNLALNGAAATGTSGSIALVNAVPGGLKDPGLGGFATMVASARYVLASDPSTGAVTYRLVEDSNGGAYLQWAPNVSAASLGGFGGAIGASAPGGISQAGAVATSAAPLNGIGGVGLGGGPTGAGASGAIGDLAAASVLPGNAACGRGRYFNAWGQVEAERVNASNDISGSSSSLSGGVEADLGSFAALGCNRLALGTFGFTGRSSSNWQTGSARTDNDGIGATLRISSPLGLYAAVVGARSWASTDLTNTFYRSQADREADGRAVTGIAGFAAPLGSGTAIDVRGFASRGTIDGSGFTDSAGIVVSGFKDDVTTYGGSIGLRQMLSPMLKGFLRAGIKQSTTDSSITAFDITQSGTAKAVAGSLEAGLVGNLTPDVTVGASGFYSSTLSGGDQTSLGIKANLSIRF